MKPKQKKIIIRQEVLIKMKELVTEFEADLRDVEEIRIAAHRTGNFTFTEIEIDRELLVDRFRSNCADIIMWNFH